MNEALLCKARRGAAGRAEGDAGSRKKPGQRLSADTIGLLCASDDRGFNTQTFLSPEDMRKYIFPWHKKIVEVAHRNGLPCVLHSCGYFGDIIDDVIDDMGFDGRHSYEDNIMPVEQAYEKYSDRIVIMGGIDVNMLTVGRPDDIYARARALIEQTKERGNYMLGSGNSIPEYIPPENYLAMIRAAWDSD